MTRALESNRRQCDEVQALVDAADSRAEKVRKCGRKGVAVSRAQLNPALAGRDIIGQAEHP